MNDPDFRALCARLVSDLDRWCDDWTPNSYNDPRISLRLIVDRTRAALAQSAPEHDPIAEFVAECKPLPDETMELLTPEARWKLYEGPDPQPAPEVPTDEELAQLLFDDHRTVIEFVCESEPEGNLMIQNHLKFARAVLARWGQGNG